MNDRIWHVVHADGCEWTTYDLERWAKGHPDAGMVYCDMDGFLIDEYGGLSIADECGNVCYVGETEDMRLVWDGQGDEQC